MKRSYFSLILSATCYTFPVSCTKEVKRHLLTVLLIIFTFFHITGCSKSREPKVQILEAEGYLIGYHPCVANATVKTSRGEGKGYLVAVTGSNPDTLMVYGVPLGMFDIPEEWFFHTGAYLFPEEGRKRFQMHFSYQRSTESKEIELQYACNAMYPLPNIKYLKPEYIVIKAERIE